MRSIELFAGAGGLALGASRVGFRHEAVIEWNRNACETIRRNQEANHPLVRGWQVHEADVATIDYTPFKGDIALLGGGPPCQPFSLGGKHRAHRDKRDMFPEVFRAVRELHPKAVLVENVKGLLRRSFASYFEYLVLQLTYPEMSRRTDESWEAHLGRLERHHTTSSHRGELTYNVVYRLVNAANYGVPQSRERVVIVAFRGDLDVNWSFPVETHSSVALQYDKWVTGDYWERHRIAKRNRPEAPSWLRSKKVPEQLKNPSAHAPWLTVRDALVGLPDPKSDKATKIPNHQFQGGARTYPGHTGSPFDEPAKTLKAGVHGVPGGENMLAYPNGDVRYFTVRESARLQGFPDDYLFAGSWTESMRQLGNAVPVPLAEVVTRSVMSTLEGTRSKGKLRRAVRK